MSTTVASPATHDTGIHQSEPSATPADTDSFLLTLTDRINDSDLSLTGHDRTLFVTQVGKMYSLCCDLYGIDTAKQKTKQFADDFVRVCAIGAQHGQQSTQYIEASHRMHQRVLNSSETGDSEVEQVTGSGGSDALDAKQPINAIQKLYKHLDQLRHSILSTSPADSVTGGSDSDLRMKAELEAKLDSELKYLQDAASVFESTDVNSAAYQSAIASLGWNIDAADNPLVKLSAALDDTDADNADLSVNDKLRRVNQQLKLASHAVKSLTQQQQHTGASNSNAHNNSSDVISVTTPGAAVKPAASADLSVKATVNGQQYTYSLHTISPDMSPADTVLLETTDQQIIHVPKSVAIRCGAIKSKLDKAQHGYARIAANKATPTITISQQSQNKNTPSIETSGTVPAIKLTDVSMSTLKRVLDFCATAFPADSQQFMTELRNTPITAVKKPVDDANNAILCELASASFYLDCKPLVELSCRAIAESIRGKSPEQIRQAFNIENDFTPNEERAIQKEMVAHAMFLPPLDDYVSPQQIAESVISDGQTASGKGGNDAQNKFAAQLSQQISQLTGSKPISDLKAIELPSQSHSHTPASLLSSTLPLDKLPTQMPNANQYVSQSMNSSLPAMDCGCEGCHHMQSHAKQSAYKRGMLNMPPAGALPLPPLPHPHNAHSHYHSNNAVIARNKLRNKLQSSRNAANANGKSAAPSSNDSASPTHDPNLSVDELLDFINETDSANNKSKNKAKSKQKSKQAVVASKPLSDSSALNNDINTAITQNNAQKPQPPIPQPQLQATKPTIDTSTTTTQSQSAASTPSVNQPFTMPTFNDFQLGTKSVASTPSHISKSHLHEHKHMESPQHQHVLPPFTLNAQVEQRLHGLDEWEKHMAAVERDVNALNEPISDSKTDGDLTDESVRLDKAHKYLQRLQASMSQTIAHPLNTHIPVMPMQQLATWQLPMQQPQIQAVRPQHNDLHALASMPITIPTNVADALKSTNPNNLQLDAYTCHCVHSNLVSMSVNSAIQPTLLVCDKCGLLPPAALNTNIDDVSSNKAKSSKSAAKPTKIETPAPVQTPAAAPAVPVKQCEGCSKLEKQVKSSSSAVDDKIAAMEKVFNAKMAEMDKQWQKKLIEEGNKRIQLESYVKKIDLVVTEQIHTIDKHRDKIDTCTQQLTQHRTKVSDELTQLKDTAAQQSTSLRASIDQAQQQTSSSFNAALQSMESSMMNRYKPYDVSMEQLRQQLSVLHKKYDDLYAMSTQQQVHKAQPRHSHVNNNNAQPQMINAKMMNNNAPVFVPAKSPRHSSQHSHGSGAVNSPQPSQHPHNKSLSGQQPSAPPPSSTAQSSDPWARQPINTDEYGLNIGGFGSSTWSSGFSSSLPKYSTTEPSVDNDASRTLRMLGLDDRDTA